MRERFRDGAGVLVTYEWHVGHHEEDGEDRRHGMRRTVTTDGVNFVRQQGDASPSLLRYSGTILHQQQYDTMMAYFLACRTRTVFFRDYTGIEREVVITAFNPKRQSVLRNPRVTGGGHIWKYTIEMEVID